MIICFNILNKSFEPLVLYAKYPLLGFLNSNFIIEYEKYYSPYFFKKHGFFFRVRIF